MFDLNDLSSTRNTLSSSLTTPIGDYMPSGNGFSMGCQNGCSGSCDGSCDDTCSNRCSGCGDKG